MKPQWRKPVSKITDRAKRYRANHPAIRPRGPKVCALKLPNGRICRSRRFVTVHHRNGDESDFSRRNLCWACKSCNTRDGAKKARLGIGKRTRQYNPDKKGGAKNIAEYAIAAASHTRGAHDEGGAIIHHTPKSKRRFYAREFADIKRQRGTDRRNPKKKTGKRKRNASAEELYTEFHGRGPNKTLDSGMPAADYNSHKKLAQLGTLVSLYVGERIRLRMSESKGITGYDNLDDGNPGWLGQFEFNNNPPELTAEKNGHQIFFLGGNQDISRYLGSLDVDLRKELLDLGPCVCVEYSTEKHFDDYRRIVYFHALGEESGKFPGDNGLNPRLMYNRVNRRLYLVGGRYTVKPEGIVD